MNESMSDFRCLKVQLKLIDEQYSLLLTLILIN